ncbi:BZ3500_MvSof-1268-A1-R1_Chr6-3g08696 [Microbotryum saponariae]|uniref:ATP-dependent DNA helicase II subunit 2 n=1 Tax=Microbotryum saponariae TaxID=289078 RepID=A0A2X0L426_9BASI|nr:BZ3500_MvSof-1268-A1-R1_Chr6-3g08696 [Microbotryum saponariae]SDA07297.1 BZ3501_MvSof-1269-A2-R1_Chr6-2g08399 [Microbotryum saponariae]
MSMTINPRSAALFVVDCSSTMASPQPTVLEPNSSPLQLVPLELAKRIIKAKIVQRIMRTLKTTPIAILAYAAPKTKNVLFAQEKVKAADEGTHFDKSASLYRHMYIQQPFTADIHVGLLDVVDQLQGDQPEEGEDPYPADAHSALILALEEIRRMDKFATYTHREIYFFTDGESTADWDRCGETVETLKQEGVAVHTENETHWRQIVEDLNTPLESKNPVPPPPSTLVSFSRYLEILSRPVVSDTRSVDVNMTLTLGDVKEHPDESIRMHVVVKKAITAGKTPSMKQMSIKSFPKAKVSYGYDTSAKASPVASTSRSGLPVDVSTTTSTSNGGASKYRLGDLGKSLKRCLSEEGLELPAEDDLGSHSVNREKRFYYLRQDNPEEALEISQADQAAVGKAKDFVHGRGGQPSLDELRDATDADLTDAYAFGGTLVPVTSMDEARGKLKYLEMGMEIVGFMKQKQIRYDWRLEDVRYVHAQVGQIGSGKLFSAFINAMVENRSSAIVRFVGRGTRNSTTHEMNFPDPQMGVMVPVIRQGLEYCYWCRMPFAEDMRLFYFPSLTEFRNQKGKIVKEHKYLATQEQKDTMDQFVDSMNLEEGTGPDGETKSWFNIQDSYSPATHNINNTLMFRLTNPEGELPPVHPALTKYLDPPTHLVEANRDLFKQLGKVMDTKLVPPKPKRIARGKVPLTVQDDHSANPNDLFADEGDDVEMGKTGMGKTSALAMPVPQGFGAGPMETDEDGEGKVEKRSTQVKEEETSQRDEKMVVVDDEKGVKSETKEEAIDEEPVTDDEGPVTEDEEPVTEEE